MVQVSNSGTCEIFFSSPVHSHCLWSPPSPNGQRGKFRREQSSWAQRLGLISPYTCFDLAVKRQVQPHYAIRQKRNDIDASIGHWREYTVHFITLKYTTEFQLRHLTCTSCAFNLVIPAIIASMNHHSSSHASQCFETRNSFTGTVVTVTVAAIPTSNLATDIQLSKQRC
jgi:hypothetical protein